MPIALSSGNGLKGVAFIVSVGAVWECIAFACSSPQTVEINIHKREESLMFWVHAGQGLAALTIAIAAIIDPKERAAILAGGIFAMTSAEGYYLLARKRGIEKGGPSTEEYGDNTVPAQGGW